jgi:altronate hydrolase
MTDDMDVNAGRVIEGKGTLDDVAGELLELIEQTAAGEPTKSERLGHQEFILTYKSFDPLGPSCLPGVR